MKEEKENCSHYFEYSHQETKQIDAGGANFELVDVVVCTKCGEMWRGEEKLTTKEEEIEEDFCSKHPNIRLVAVLEENGAITYHCGMCVIDGSV